MSIKEANKELFQQEKIDFKLSDLEPNLESFQGRVLHFMKVTNPLNFFVGDQEIIK
jgi:hypothetical protein